MDKTQLAKVAQRLRLLILKATTQAGSGHPSSCLSAVELMSVLMFGGFYQKNDHLIFSKGHAAPLLYALLVEQGKLTEQEIMTLRDFNSSLEGHPVPGLPEIEVATGSLGIGLSIGMGMALADKRLKKNSNQTYVLLGDGELEEGSVWEAINLASYYNLDNLIAIVDVNRLEQDGQTVLGHDLQTLSLRFSSFNWQTQIVLDGHNFNQIETALAMKTDKPKVILAKTIKGQGVTLLANKDDWHGKVLSQEQLFKALKELDSVVGQVSSPKSVQKNQAVNELLVKLDKLGNG